MNETAKTIIAVAITAVVCTGGTVALTNGNGSNDGNNILNVGGSTTMQPMMVVLQEEFEDISGVGINISSGGSGVGASSTVNGTLDIGMCSRDLKPKEIDDGLVQYTIAKDAVAVIANKNVDVTTLSPEQIAKIYTGEMRNWNGVGGSDIRIAPIAREEGSGTRECFDENMKTANGGRFDMTSEATLYPSTGGVTTAVANTPGSIGYVSLNAAEKAASEGSVKILKVGEIAPSAETVNDNSYVLQRNLNLVTKGDATGTKALLINWILGNEGRKIVAEQGFIPIP